ncbi:MAG: amidohydrolase [Gammaproteobacteria bacterium]|nr:amidohydrolase [Gammaproteobacteria bacterium]
MTSKSLAVASLLTHLFLVSAPGHTEPDLIAFTDARFDAHSDLARQIWHFAELGYQEEKSSALLQATLAEAGFELEAGIAGIPTAFVASAGSGEPVIAFLAEYDALPGITQTESPVREEIPGQAGSHACGHNLLGTAAVGAAIAVKHWLEQTSSQGTVRLYGTPAEEGGSGKVYMARAGLFDDVDAVLAWHPDDESRVQGNSTLANRSAKFRFHGVSAHAAAAPEKARSALDAVEAFNFMTNLMREHVPPETRIHYVITAGGHAPNVVPDFAEVYYYVRHPDTESLLRIWERVVAAARAAAMGTGTTMDREVIHGNHALLSNMTLAEAMQKNLERVGGISYNAKEKAYAEEIYATLNQPEYALGSEATIMPVKLENTSGSTDVGDVSWNAPTVELRVATWVPGTAAHSWQAVAAGGTSIGIKGVQVAAKTLALTATDLYADPALLAQVQKEFAEQRGDDFVYEPLLGDREPPLDYRK